MNFLVGGAPSGREGTFPEFVKNRLRNSSVYLCSAEACVVSFNSQYSSYLHIILFVGLQYPQKRNEKLESRHINFISYFSKHKRIRLYFNQNHRNALIAKICLNIEF